MPLRRGRAEASLSSGIQRRQGVVVHRGKAPQVSVKAHDSRIAQRSPRKGPRWAARSAARGALQLRLLSTSLLALIQGIIARSFSPTTSIECSAIRRRRDSKRRRAGAVFQDEALGVFAALDVGQHLLHRLLRLGGHDLRARHVLAVLGVVADRIVHVGDAAFIDQVDDQLQFVQALEIRHLGRVAGFDQGFVTGLDQFHRAAAQHRLFAEQIGLGLFAEIGLDDAGLAAAIGRGVAERQVTRLAGRIGTDRDQVRHAAALHVGVAHRVARRLGRDHPHVEVGTRHDLAVVHVEAVRKGQRGALADVGFDILAVHGGNLFVRQQHHHDIGALDGIGHRRPPSARPSRPWTRTHRPCAGRPSPSRRFRSGSGRGRGLASRSRRW